MAEDVQRTEIRNETIAEEEGSYWWLYILGLLILLGVGYFIFRNNLPSFLRWGKSGGETSTSIPATDVSVTIEAEVQQVIPSQNTFFIKSNAGFTTLYYTLTTEFENETGEKITSDKIIAGSSIRAEGKPNEKIFTAKKIKLLKEGTAVKAIPTSFKLPETGIVE